MKQNVGPIPSPNIKKKKKVSIFDQGDLQRPASLPTTQPPTNGRSISALGDWEKGASNAESSCVSSPPPPLVHISEVF